MISSVCRSNCINVIYYSGGAWRQQAINPYSGGGVLVIIIGFLVLVTVLITVKCRTRLGPELKPSTDASLGKSDCSSCLEITNYLTALIFLFHIII